MIVARRKPVQSQTLKPPGQNNSAMNSNSANAEEVEMDDDAQDDLELYVSTTISLVNFIPEQLIYHFDYI